MVKSELCWKAFDIFDIYLALGKQEENAQSVETVLWEEDKEAARLCMDGVRKAKAQFELHLAGGAKNKKGFYGYLNQKMKVQEGVAPSEWHGASW